MLLCFTGRRHRRGFTILEALLSLVIAVLILSTVYSVHQTIQTVRHSAEDREEGPVAAMRILNGLSRDLVCAAPLEQAAALDLLTPPENTNASELALLTFAASEDDADLEWASIQRVHYLLRETADQRRMLVKEITPHPFTEETHVITNILLNPVTAFRVEVLSAGKWLNTCRGTSSDSWPGAVRITLQRDETEEAFQTEVFLPAGTVVSSSLTRTTASAAP